MSFEIATHYRSLRGLTATILLLTASLTSLVGCDHFFGHDKQVQDPLTMKDQGLSCVRTVGADINSFMAGEDKDPVLIVDCLSGALTKFADNTRGANPDGWTRGELSSFFETYFKEESAKSGRFQPSLGRTDGSDALPFFDGGWIAQAKRRAVVTELFRWKASLFGGSDATVSRAELTRIRDILVKARGPLRHWRGQGKILSFGASFSGQPADLETLNRVTNSIRELSVMMEGEFMPRNGKTNQPMKLQMLSASFEQAGLKVLESQERKQLVQAVKTVMLGGEPQTIAGDEWSELVHQAAELWIAALRVQYGTLQNIRAYDRDVDFVELTARELKDAITRIVDRHKGQIIPNAELRMLITQLDENKFLPSVMKAKTANASLEFIFGKLLSGNSHPKQKELSQGLQRAHLERGFEVVQDWVEGQRVGLTLMGPSGYATLDQTKIGMSEVATKGRDQIGETVRQQMSELLLRGRPLVHDGQGRLLLLPNEKVLGYRMADLSSINLSRVLMAAALRGYSHETTRAGMMPQITEAETQELFMDLRNIGRDIGIVDARSLQAGIRTFMEANIFLSVSDGNPYISLHEMVEWFETVMSAGRIADRIHSDLVSDNPGRPACGTAPNDIFGKTRIKAQCFRENVLPVFRDQLGHLPNFIHALNEAEKEKKLPEFMAVLELASRSLGNSDLPIESSDVRVMSPVIHYVEALFTRYDGNRNQTLDPQEVWSVFPLIRPFIAKLALDENGKPMQLGEKRERGIFSWLVRIGEPPGMKWYQKLMYWSHEVTMWMDFNWFTPHGVEKAKYQTIMNILASFQKVGRAKKNADIVKFYTEHGKSWEDAIIRGEKTAIEKTRDLFQCSPESDADLARLLQSRRADIFAVDPKADEDERAIEFTSRLKSMIQADPQLQLLCLGF